jgi:hypothetical protein
MLLPRSLFPLLSLLLCLSILLDAFIVLVYFLVIPLDGINVVVLASCDVIPITVSGTVTRRRCLWSSTVTLSEQSCGCGQE